jgi:hypothetical protein
MVGSAMQLEAVHQRAIAALCALESQDINADAQSKVLLLRDALLAVRDLLALSGDSVTPEPAILHVFAAELSQFIVDLEAIASRYEGIFEQSNTARHKDCADGAAHSSLTAESGPLSAFSCGKDSLTIG